MRAATCFSGIGAPECAMPEWDWRWSADIEPFPNAVRAERFPGIPNLGDVMTEGFMQAAAAMGPLDVLVGGPPCQDFSVAGLREGLSGARGNLSLRWVKIIHAIRPRWTVTENVPGWLSVNGGHAFGAFLAGLVGIDAALVPPREAGGKWTRAGMVDGPLGRAAWRILDAQYFGLAQRRERVFVVFCFGDGGDPSAVLFEPASLRGDPAPRREAGQGVARPIAVGSPGGSGYRNDADTADNLIAAVSSGHGWWDEAEVGATLRGQDSITKADTLIARCLTAHPGRSDGETETFTAHTPRAGIFNDSKDGKRRVVPSMPVAFGWQNSASQGGSVSPHTTPTLDKSKTPAVIAMAAVRRLTPRECERLQGFPDDFTLVPYRKGMASDGPRYRALGNSMAVPVMRWIGRRISLFNKSSAKPDFLV